MDGNRPERVSKRCQGRVFLAMRVRRRSQTPTPRDWPPDRFHQWWAPVIDMSRGGKDELRRRLLRVSSSPRPDCTSLQASRSALMGDFQFIVRGNPLFARTP
jgi:hypothetical protein